MKQTVSFYTKIKDKKVRKKIYSLNKFLLKQNEKVAYAYKNLVTEDFFAFNYDLCFYAASSIKFLVDFYIYQEAEKEATILDKRLLIQDGDLKQGSGVIRESGAFSVRELISYTLKESDNTAYVKLVEFVGKEKLMQFGYSLGANHPLEGKDFFGITNAFDMVLYLDALYHYLETGTKLSQELKQFILNPSVQFIQEKREMVRKYGRFGIAYHEVGIVYDEQPYIFIVITQKNEL